MESQNSFPNAKLIKQIRNVLRKLDRPEEEYDDDSLHNSAPSLLSLWDDHSADHCFVPIEYPGPATRGMRQWQLGKFLNKYEMFHSIDISGLRIMEICGAGDLIDQLLPHEQNKHGLFRIIKYLFLMSDYRKEGRVACPGMLDYTDRLETLTSRKWLNKDYLSIWSKPAVFMDRKRLPLANCTHKQLFRLAIEGFFYNEEENRVMCYHCGQFVDHIINIHINPEMVHKMVNPDCPLVSQVSFANLMQLEVCKCKPHTENFIIRNKNVDNFAALENTLKKPSEKGTPGFCLDCEGWIQSRNLQVPHIHFPTYQLYKYPKRAITPWNYPKILHTEIHLYKYEYQNYPELLHVDNKHLLQDPMRFHLKLPV